MLLCGPRLDAPGALVMMKNAPGAVVMIKDSPGAIVMIKDAPGEGITIILAVSPALSALCGSRLFAIRTP